MKDLKVCDGCPDRYEGCGIDWYQNVKDFHEQVVLDNFQEQPYIPKQQLKLLRGELIIEEICETLDAIDKDDIVAIADGICDSIVVLLGTAITYGIDIRPVWNEVHKTNMAKKGGKIREDGKLLKPDGWEPPDIERIIKEQQNERTCSGCGWTGKESDCSFGHNDFYCPSCCKEALEIK